MRKPRLRNEVAGSTYHVMARGVDRRRIFMDDDDYEVYTGILATVVERKGWLLLSYCLMPNHVHLVVETPEANLATGMQLLHGRYARSFNVRHDRKGHLFEETYLSPLITNETDFVRTVRYVADNPVKAGLCAAARNWPWGSAAILESETDAGWIANRRLRERLTACVGYDCYEELVSTCIAMPY
jgi:REP element-mobilizing transposase RayT